LAGFVVRREGKKFLKLKQHSDDSKINTQILRQGEELISLYPHSLLPETLSIFAALIVIYFKKIKLEYIS